MDTAEIKEARVKLELKYKNIRFIFQQLSAKAERAKLGFLIGEEQEHFDDHKRVAMVIVGLSGNCSVDEVMSGMREILKGMEQLLLLYN